MARPAKVPLSEKFEMSADPSNGMTQNESLEMSLPTVKVVHGIEIRKMPLRPYMKFIKKGGGLVPIILDKLFPGMSTTSVVTGIMGMNRSTGIKLITDLLIEMPEAIIDAISELIGCETGDLYDNPNIGPNELLDIWDEWNKLNDLTGFFGRASNRFLPQNPKSSQTL